MGDKVIIEPYDAGWVDEYRELEKMIKEQMGELAERFPENREGYVAGKESLIWDIMKRADRWAQETGWTSEAL